MQNIQTEIWKIEREILDVIHNICVEHDLRYSLAYGTLIGAVRHKGFIPWDDDIDIMMPRDDYEKLLSLWNQVAPKGYLLQDYHTCSDYTNNFAKVVKDHTTYLQNEEDRTKSFHKGLFVDIFPADRLAPGKLRQKIQFVACAINLLYSREHSSGMSGIIGIIEKILLVIPKRFHVGLRDKAEKVVRNWNKLEDGQYLFPCTIRSCKWHYSPDLFRNLESIEFNGKSYSAISDYDTYLKTTYGDYMQLPPEEERVWKHHPILIDFEHNYEELTDQQ